jgi:hypothetical protein
LKAIHGHFFVLDGDTDQQLEDTECNWLFLILGLPETAVHFDLKDILGNFIEVSFAISRLDLKHDE